MKLRRAGVRIVNDGDGHYDEMPEYDDRGEFYFAEDVDAMIEQDRDGLSSAMQSDLESGVRCLNEANAARFKADYPRLYEWICNFNR
jgi:hypothetical protein